jgi:hypothetical protein
MSFVRSPCHAGCCLRSRSRSARSSGFTTVTVQSPAIFAPGPASPRIAPFSTASRVATCDGLLAAFVALRVVNQHEASGVPCGRLPHAWRSCRGCGP